MAALLPCAKRRLRRLLAMALCWLLAPAAGAAVHAVLVGVSGYPSLPAQKRLAGPRNDVTLIADALRGKGVQDIRILADGHPGSSGTPTRAAILAALERAAVEAQPRDWLIFYFSGHGAQQPQPARPTPGAWREPDALDELFLPFDIGRWDGRQGGVANAIVDDEIAAAIQRAADRGVSVWAIFDACHAGDMAKGLPAAAGAAPARVWRGVAPDLLGIPPGGARSRPGRGKWLPPEVVAKGAARARGQVVAFYASQPDEPAAEENLWAAAGGERAVGVFTWHLASLLRAPAAPVQFGALMQAVQARYRVEQRPFPTPSMEGAAGLPLPF